jgi:urease accessory protein
VITFTHIFGRISESSFSEKLHQLEHEDNVDYVSLSSEDIQRKRLKVISYKGKECGIALPREQKLFDGAILSIADDYALVVRCKDVKWLRCTAIDTATALELGYFAGNMHWSVRFEKNILEIELKGRLEDYQQRLAHLCADGRVKLELENA